jgi:ATP-binding cassette, subfamily B, bacterial PglK
MVAKFLALTPAGWQFLIAELARRQSIVYLNVLGGVITAILEITGIGLVFPLLAVIMRPESLQSIPFAPQFFSAIGITGQKELTLFLAVAIAVIQAIKALYMIAFYRWQFKAFSNWKSELSRRVMRMYLMSDFKLHMEKTPSEMIRNLSLANIVFDHYIIALLNVTINMIVVVAISSLLYITLPGETLFAVGVLAVAALTISKLTKKHFSAIGVEGNELYRLRNVLLNQSIAAIRETKILGKERFFLDAFTKVEQRTFSQAGYYNFLASLPGLIMEGVIVVAMLAVVVNVVFIVGGGTAGLALVGLLAAAMFRLLPMVIRSMSNVQIMNFGRPSLELLAGEIAACEIRVQESFIEDGERLRGWKTIELENVGYAYPDGTIALHGVTATIHRTEFVGITGRSGSGKSTLMMLLLGLLEPTEGRILVDGRPLIGADTLRRWQNGIGFVPQGLFLVQGTIADNVAFGAPNPDLARVQWAVETAQLGDYVRLQPHGVLEPVGEHGSKLSGGQKQRVVIARAMYKDPDLIAFDEATAALDVQAERALTDYLAQFKTEKTMLAIAHRISTIRHCDRIMYLEAGKLSGFAAFDQLKTNNPGFAQLAALSNL